MDDNVVKGHADAVGTIEGNPVFNRDVPTRDRHEM